MEKILNFVMKNLSSIYRDKGFKFVDSGLEQVYGESSYIVLSCENLNITISNSRDGLEFLFSAVGGDKNNEQYTLDVVIELCEGQVKKPTKNLIEEAEFINKNIEQILNLFSIENFVDTKAKLRKLELARSKKLFK